MNTFALLLFAWVLYLAVNGRLPDYLAFAKAPVGQPPASGK